MNLFAKNPFGHYLFIKKMIIRYLGMLSSAVAMAEVPDACVNTERLVANPNRFFQTLNLTYKLPFSYVPILSFRAFIWRMDLLEAQELPNLHP